jgi:lactoylglutathione lyase
MCVYATDVEAAVGDLPAAGVPALAEAADQPWGERLAYVAEPDGNPVMITAPSG